MKDFYVLWTYLGNHSSVMHVPALSAESVRDAVFATYSDDFGAKATVYVFDRRPVLTSLPGKR
jgi:hypothetical protein